MTYSQKDLEYLVGLDRVPTKGPVPAAWWVSVHPELIDAYDQWKADYAAHSDKVQALGAGIGVDDIGDARAWVGFDGNTVLSGFTPPHAVTLWAGHPDHIPVPAGWRLDRKENRLVPSRKTKADRESQASKDFAAVRKIPDIRSYMRGLPMSIMLDDRDFGGTIYSVDYRRGHLAVMAFTGADPDRSERPLSIDTSLWQRQKLSALLVFREAVAEKTESP